MIHSTPLHHRRNRLTAALLASVLFATMQIYLTYKAMLSLEAILQSMEQTLLYIQLNILLQTYMLFHQRLDY